MWIFSSFFLIALAGLSHQARVYRESELRPKKFDDPDQKCNCIPLYNCKDENVVSYYDAGLINDRLNQNPCGDHKVCCRLEGEEEGKIEEKQSELPSKSNLCKTDLQQTDIARFPVRSPNGCGYRNRDGVGFKISPLGESNEAAFGEFPWMVALFPEDRGTSNVVLFSCSGTLIHPQVILTAAHCVSDERLTMVARAGEWDTSHTQEIYPHQDRKVDCVRIHPEYRRGAVFNDIALVVLESPFNLMETVDVICLPTKDTYEGAEKCLSSSWSSDRGAAEILNKRELNLHSREKCSEKLKNICKPSSLDFNRTFTCSERNKLNKEGGSPVICPKDSDKYYQAGIVTWDDGCAQTNVTEFYVDVALYRDWIDEQMILSNFDTSVYKH